MQIKFQIRLKFKLLVGKMQPSKKLFRRQLEKKSFKSLHCMLYDTLTYEL